MQAVAKSGLTKALEELTTLLPKALECCTGTEPSQNSPIVEKLRSVLLELIQGCLSCNAGGLVISRVFACSWAGDLASCAAVQWQHEPLPHPNPSPPLPPHHHSQASTLLQCCASCSLCWRSCRQRLQTVPTGQRWCTW